MPQVEKDLWNTSCLHLLYNTHAHMKKQPLHILRVYQDLSPCQSWARRWEAIVGVLTAFTM